MHRFLSLSHLIVDKSRVNYRSPSNKLSRCHVHLLLISEFIFIFTSRRELSFSIMFNVCSSRLANSRRQSICNRSKQFREGFCWLSEKGIKNLGFELMSRSSGDSSLHLHIRHVYWSGKIQQQTISLLNANLISRGVITAYSDKVWASNDVSQHHVD